MRFLSIFLIILFFFIVFNQRGFMKNNDLTLKIMAFKNIRKPSDFDPAKIHFAPEYLYLENIYSPLVEYNVNGELVSGVAKNFRWEGNQAIFEIREDLYTADGYKITAYDAEKSFKRLFILNTNTHGNLKDMLCPNTELKSIGESCANIEVRDNGKTLVMKFKKKHPFLFPMLTAIDFAVIPSISIDEKTLAIKDHRNTSGPYYAISEENLDLEANKKHYHYNKKMPQKVLYIYENDINNFDLIKAFSEKKHDHITTVSSTPDKLIPFARANKEVVLHKTYPFWLRLVSFTAKGRREISKKERFEIGETLRKILLDCYLKSEGYEIAEQIFPSIAEGNLSSEQLNDINKLRNSFSIPKINKRKMIAWYFPQEFLSEIKKYFPNTQFIYGKGIPGIIDYKKEGFEEPHFYFSGTDMSFQEDISLISYHLSKDMFKTSGKEAKEWLKDYMETDDKVERIKKLNKLHYETLSEGYVFPIVFAPYAAILRKPWKFGLSRYYANNPIWRIYRE